MAPVSAHPVEKPHTEALKVQVPIRTSLPKGHPFNKTKRVPPTDKSVKPLQQKSIPTRSSKPIINWLQRKLAGSGKAKRENHRAVSDVVPPPKARVVSIPRVVSSPVPSPSYSGRRQQGTLDSVTTAPRKAVSLNAEDIHDFPVIDDFDGNSLDQSSLARDSTWSPGSALEADEDASLRPLPPSTPPSPSPSRSSSSYLSDPRTFKSIAASTKPTTLLSVDINGNGMAHIAQAPATSPTHLHRFPPHIRTSSSINNPIVHGSGTSITFSALPQSSPHPSGTMASPGVLQTAPHSFGTFSSVQAPLHTTHHPRNNPRPSSPPLDNASVLTLASSAYAIPGLRAHTTSPSARGVGDSLSHFGGSITYADAESTSQYILGDDERMEERDVNASVRALRPRSSRRGSWESEASRWSARDQLGAGASLLARERSLRTTNSVKTGILSPDNPETFDRSGEIEKVEDKENLPVLSISDPPVSPPEVCPPPSLDSGRVQEHNATKPGVLLPPSPEAADPTHN